MRGLFLFALLLSLAACSLNSTMGTVYTNQNVFEANDAEPCVRITFPELVAYENYYHSVTENEDVKQYILKLANNKRYLFTLSKVQNLGSNGEWAIVPLSEQFTDDEKIYQTPHSYKFPERSGVVVFFEKDDGIYIRGMVGEYVSRDKALFMSIDRIIQKNEYIHTFSPEDWKRTKSGKMFINDMNKKTDFFFNSMEVTSCMVDPSVKRMLKKR